MWRFRARVDKWKKRSLILPRTFSKKRKNKRKIHFFKNYYSVNFHGWKQGHFNLRDWARAEVQMYGLSKNTLTPSAFSLKMRYLTCQEIYLILLKQVKAMGQGSESLSHLMLMLDFSSVTYWHQLSYQKRKCICVNNRCIRSKISGGDFDCWGIELSANFDDRRK